MRYGNHMMGYGFYGGYILMSIFLILITIIAYILFKNKKPANPEVIKLITFLKYSYANGKISTEEYKEKRNILESSDLSNPTIFALVEMYIKSSISLKDLYLLNQQLDAQELTKDETINFIKKDLN